MYFRVSSSMLEHLVSILFVEGAVGPCLYPIPANLCPYPACAKFTCVLPSTRSIWIQQLKSDCAVWMWLGAQRAFCVCTGKGCTTKQKEDVKCP